MEFAFAKTKYCRVPPRKARLAAALIRGLSVADASAQLNFCGMKGGYFLKKTLDSAVANAENQLDMQRGQLRVIEVRVDEGPTWKRSKGRNRGGRMPIQKKTSHFTVVVGSQEGVL